MTQKTTTLSNWINNSIKLESHTPFRFEGRRWGPAIYDTQNRWRLMKCSRQVGKSTILSAEGAARGSLQNGFRTLYVAPVEDQARKFSKDRVAPLIDNSPIVASQIADSNSVYEKSFERGGRYYFKYAKYSADSIRGISCDMVQFDEVQDQDIEEHAPVIEEAMFTSEYKKRMYAGTPKSFANPIENLWQDSDQREWVVRCNRHSPGKWINLGLKNIGKEGPICHHCGELLDVENGRWVKHNPDGRIAGFHIHQLHCKISHRTQEDWREILVKMENYPDAKFLNEVLGMSADTADVPLVERDIKRLCDPDLEIQYKPRADYMSAPLYAGIDWGHGSAATALAIGHFKNGKFRYVFFKTYQGDECDPDYCIPDMADIINKYKCSRVHCDYGGGFGLNSDLKKKVKAPLTVNVWSHSVNAADKRFRDKNVDIHRMVLNKSKYVGNFIQGLKRREYTFPQWKQVKHLKDHFLNVRRERDKNDNIRYVRAGQDDLFQAALYSYVIAKAVN